MAASNAKAPVVTLVLFCGVAAATLLWQHMARGPEPTPAPTAPSTPTPAPSAPVPAPSVTPPPAPAQKVQAPSNPPAAPPAPVPAASAPPAPSKPEAAAPASPPAPPAAPPSPEGHASAASGASTFGTPPASPAPPPAETAPAGVPHFDVVRVEPSGEAVVAGKAAPQSEVQLLASGKVVANGTTDAVGNFVLIPPRLDPGSYDLTLRVTGKTPRDSQQSVAVSVPPRSGGQVVVALSEPGRPTQLLSAPPAAPAKSAEPQASPESSKPAAEAPAPSTEAPKAETPKAETPKADTAKADTAKTETPAPAAATQPELAIRSVELENGNGVIASGVAVPGSRIQLYLNDTPLAAVQAAPDGTWSLTVKKGLTAGHYTVRADASADGKTVVLRAEVPFDVPVAMAEAKPEPAKPEPPKSASTPLVKSAPTPSVQPESTPEAAPPAAQAQAPASPSTQHAAPGVAPAPTPAAPPAEARADAAPPSTPSAAPAGAAPRQPQTAARETVPTASTSATSAPEAAPTTPAASGTQGATSATTTAAAPSEPSSSHAVIEQVDTTTVIRGDNLWKISRHRYGLGRRYTQIYAANTDQIRNPRLIYPGQVLVIPPK